MGPEGYILGAMGEHETISVRPGPGQDRDILRVTLWALAGNLLLAVSKMLAGHFGGSRAVLADGVHSFSDLGTDLAVLIGLRYWSAPRDECHPYGHRRIETLVTVAIGLALAGAAASIALEAAAAFRQPASGPPGLVALGAALLSIVVNEVLYRWTRAVGVRCKSPATVANAWHHRTDAFSSIPAALAVGGAVILPGWSFLDTIGALVVSLFIFKTAWDIARPALAELTDRSAGAEAVAAIQELARSVPGVRECHAIRTRRHGPGIHADLHILVDPDLSVKTGHDIAREVRQTIQSRGPDVMDVVVHVEPFNSEESREVLGKG